MIFFDLHASRLCIVFVIIKVIMFTHTLNATTVKTKLGEYRIELPPMITVEIPVVTPVKIQKPQIRNLLQIEKEYHFIESSLLGLNEEEQFYVSGLSFLNQELWKQSIEYFQQLRLKYPDTIYLQSIDYWSGVAHKRLGNYQKANQYFSQVQSYKNSSDYLYWSLLQELDILLENQQWNQFNVTLQEYKKFIPQNSFQQHLQSLDLKSKIKQSKWYLAQRVLKKKQQENYTLAWITWKRKNLEELNQLTNDTSEQHPNHPKLDQIMIINYVLALEKKDWIRVLEIENIFEHRGILQDHQSLFWGKALRYIYQNQWEQVDQLIQQIEDPILSLNLQKHLLFQLIQNEEYERGRQVIQNLPSPLAWNDQRDLLSAYIYEKLFENQEKAYPLYKKVINTTQSLPEIQEKALFLMARIELLYGQFQKANEKLKKLLVTYLESKHRKEYYFWYGITQQELESGNAILSLRQISKEHPRYPVALLHQGRIQKSLGKWKSAEKNYSTLIRRYMNSEYWEIASLEWAETLYFLERYQDAEKILSQVFAFREKLENPLETIILQAKIMIALERLREANSYLEQQIEFYPDFALIRLRLQILYQMQANQEILRFSDEVLHSWELAKEERTWLYYHKANALFVLGEKEESTVYYSKALQTTTPKQRRFIEYRLIKLALETNQIDDFLSKSDAFLASPLKDEWENQVLTLVSNHYQGQPQSFPYLQRLRKNYEQQVEQDEIEGKEKVELFLDLSKINHFLNDLQKSDTWLDRTFEEKITKEQKRRAFLLRAQIGKKQKNHQKVVSNYLKILHLYPQMKEREKLDYYSKVAYNYSKLEKKKETIEIYQKLLSFPLEPAEKSKILEKLNRK